MQRLSLLTLSISFALGACGGTGAGPGAFESTGITIAAGAISDTSLLQTIKDLSDDSLLGRAPGGPAEPMVISYLIGRFKSMGLEPGNPDGSWTQNVELIGSTVTPEARFTIHGRNVPLVNRVDYVAATRRETPEVDVTNSPLVFVGYGVEAPEYQWDDYKGADLKGKTLVMLVNDPPVPDPNDSTRLDSTVFHGKGMTYYGRWTYKYEIASRKGAAAALIVHQTDPAGYGWDVVDHSWSHENMTIQTPDSNQSRVAVEGWITLDRAKQLFRNAGLDFDSLERAARSRDFQPVALNGTATFHLKNAVREVHSHNVIAALPGRDSANEYVLYTAHWDHLGVVTPVNGDSIANGAIDNASGVAGMLEIAKAWKALPTAPHRTALFMAVTAEEKGLLGAEYYATHPLYPLNRTLANFNIDGVNQWGPTTDLVVIGKGASTLEDLLDSAATAHDRTLSPDPEPEKGFYYRADHFAFAKEGVPSMFLDAGTHYIDKPADYSHTKRDYYTEHDYHNVTDEVKPDWDLRGAVQDLRLLFAVGVHVANDATWPTWKPGNEFKSIRERSLAATDRTP